MVVGQTRPGTGGQAASGTRRSSIASRGRRGWGRRDGGASCLVGGLQVAGLKCVIGLALFGAVEVAIADEPRSGEAEQQYREDLARAIGQYEQAVVLEKQDPARAKALYREALEGFLRVIHGGVRNGRLYYNAANAQMRLGQLGPAIANYRRGERLLPGDANIRRNLAFARSLCELQIEPPGRSEALRTMFSWHFDTAASSRKTVALGAFVLCWCLLEARLLLRMFRGSAMGLGWAALAAGIVAAAGGSSVAANSYAAHNHREGVVLAESAIVRKGNSEAYQPQLDRALSEGVEFRILEQRSDTEANEWYRVELADGKDGWLRADQAEVI